MAFDTLLVANRGEIACRIIRSARSLGLSTVAVFSDADAGAAHVAAADRAVRIGPAPAAESYLNIPAILAAAAESKAGAVHPGYGFLAENADFAEACAAAGLVFVGPPASAIRAMGDKAAAKRRMREAGVPCIPGYEGDDQSEAALLEAARAIGLPLMVKAAAGGGGRGMRLVRDMEALPAALADARTEAEAAFGSGRLILERALVEPRHVEVQVLGDGHGTLIHLGERDCSVQRRWQKVIEEAPSPAVDSALRAAMGEAALAAARSVGYVGAGTVEFMLEADGRFHFMEMNTRLQVEHAVTEAVTGLDLVALQLRIAQGEPLPLTQADVRLDGHAIEARIYAEDPAAGFLPQTGRIAVWRPAEGPGIRIDHGLAEGAAVTAWYDPLLAKAIAHGPTREAARQRLIDALNETVLLGVASNRAFLAHVLAEPEFAEGQATTGFIGRRCATAPSAARPGQVAIALAAAALFEAEASAVDAGRKGWSSSGPLAWPLRLDWGGRALPVTVSLPDPDSHLVRWRQGEVRLRLKEGAGARIDFEADGIAGTAWRAQIGEMLHLQVGAETLSVRDSLFDAPEAAATGGDRVLAPMNGRIAMVLAEPGETVARGQRLAVLEAMKMQHELTAPRDGTVASVAVKTGDQVAAKQVLLEMAETDAS